MDFDRKKKVAAATIATVAAAYALYKLLKQQPVATPASKILKEYDYIVIGSGSAGAVVASRLAEDPDVSVLVLEAGGEDDLDFPCRIPVGSYLLQGTQRDWKFMTEKQEHSHKMFKNEQSKWPRGKVIGGSSILNYMAYVRGNPADYDSWEALGCTGWSYRDVLPFFKKSENVRVPELINSEFHGTDGPLSVSKSGAEHPITNRFFEACKEFGIKYNPDYNSNQQFGASKFQHTTKNGVRWSTARAFLRPALAKHKNLHLICYAHVSRVVFNSKNEAVGVAYQITRDGKTDGQEIIINARREVICSAGAVQSPQILLLSGIGPKAALEKLGIPVVFDNPNVGENLRDHTMLPLWTQTRIRTFTERESGSLMTLLRYLFFKTGPLASTILEGTAFYRTGVRSDLKEQPDMQIHFTPFGATQKDSENTGLKAEFFREENYVTGEWVGGMGFLPTLLHPKSTGYIRLRSKNPLDPPVIQPHYFSDEDDVKVLVEGAKMVKSFLDSPPFKAIHGGILQGVLGETLTKKYPEFSDKWWAEYVRHGACTVYHPVGTCAMGPPDSKTAVLNPQLQVLGVSRLRVIDASIMPTHVSGNTNAPCIMIGEKGADLIKSSWKK